MLQFRTPTGETVIDAVPPSPFSRRFKEHGEGVSSNIDCCFHPGVQHLSAVTAAPKGCCNPVCSTRLSSLWLRCDAAVPDSRLLVRVAAAGGVGGDRGRGRRPDARCTAPSCLSAVRQTQTDRDGQTGRQTAPLAARMQTLAVWLLLGSRNGDRPDPQPPAGRADRVEHPLPGERGASWTILRTEEMMQPCLLHLRAISLGAL